MGNFFKKKDKTEEVLQKIDIEFIYLFIIFLVVGICLLLVMVSQDVIRETNKELMTDLYRCSNQLNEMYKLIPNDIGVKEFYYIDIDDVITNQLK